MTGLILLPLAVLAASALLAGCGSETPSSTTSTRSGTEVPREAGPAPGPPASAFHPKPHHDSGGGSAQFHVEGDNSVQEFGEEGSEPELQRAAAVLHGFLDARAERNWAAACSYLNRTVKQSLAQLGGRSARSCAAALAALTGKVPTSTLREAAVADVGSLREEGAQAFLVYRGAGEGIYAIAMQMDGGAWKVASLSGAPLD